MSLFARRVSEFRICVQEAFLSLLPVALLSSIIIVLINGLNIFLPNQYLIPDTLLVEAGKIPALIYPLALTAALSYYLSGFFEVDRVSGVLLALTTYLMAQQLVGNGAQETSFNASLTVMILPILMLRIFATMSGLLRSVARQHAQGAVFQPVTLIVPLTLTILIGAALIYPLYHLVEALTQGIAYVLNAIPGTLGVAIWSTLAHLIWFVGFHGTNVMSMITGGDLQSDIIPGLTWQKFLEVFIGMGGVGSVLGLALAILLTAKDRYMRAVAYLGLPFALFNISEVLIFGIPIILNRVLLIPFLLAPIVNFTIAYGVLKLGIFEFGGASVPWVAPVGLNGYLLTGSSYMVLFQLFLLVTTTAIYAPFVCRYSRTQSSTELREALRAKLHLGDAIGSDYSQKFYGAQSFILRSHRETRQVVEDLRRNDLVLHYQPKLDIRANTCTSIEALLRIQMQDGTVEGPYFLDTLEKAGFSVILDRWVCDRVLEDMSRAGTLGSDLAFSINLNPESFADGEFVDYLIQQFTGKNVVFEIIERGFIGGSGITKNIKKLLAAGIRLSVDDFGAGYSNLGRLTTLPVDEIKIDKSLLAKVDTQTGRKLYETVTRLCRDLGYRVVAEGVETRSEFEFAKTCGVTEIQGWYIAGALPLSEALAFARAPASSSAPAETAQLV